MQTQQPDTVTSSKNRGGSRRRRFAGLLATALVVGVGAVIGYWRTRPPEGAPGASDPERRDSRPW